MTNFFELPRIICQELASKWEEGWKDTIAKMLFHQNALYGNKLNLFTD